MEIYPAQFVEGETEITNRKNAGVEEGKETNDQLSRFCQQESREAMQSAGFDQ